MKITCHREKIDQERRPFYLFFFCETIVDKDERDSCCCWTPCVWREGWKWACCTPDTQSPCQQSKRWIGLFRPFVVSWYDVTERIGCALHCKDTIPKIRKKYSQKWNCAALRSRFLHSCICERFLYIPKIGMQNRCTDPWEKINRSQIHKCGNWEQEPRNFMSGNT
jgi:hypothetical protein